MAIRPGRLAVRVSQEMAVIRQFWFYVRRLHPAQCRRDVRWPGLPTKTTFVPQVFTTAEIRTLLHIADASVTCIAAFNAGAVARPAA